MLEEARRILAVVDRARERMHEVVRGSVGRIRLGATPTAASYVVPALHAEYRRRHSAYDVHFEVGECVIRNETHFLRDRLCFVDEFGKVNIFTGPAASRGVTAGKMSAAATA